MKKHHFPAVWMAAMSLTIVAGCLPAHDPTDRDLEVGRQHRAAQATPEQCYVAADSNDLLLVVDKNDLDPDTNTAIIGNFGAPDIEAIAIDPTTARLYGAGADQLGVIDLDTGAFTPTSQPFGTGSGALGDVTFVDVDGLAFDPRSGVLFGSSRREGSNDVLLMIDKDTGAFVPGAFGPGIDYIEISGASVDIDDIAIDLDGTMYAISNDSGVADQLVIIDKLTGQTTQVGPTNEDDLEGLGFDAAGQLWAASGASLGLFLIDKVTGAAGTRVPINADGDYEGVACLISGDSDGDGIGDIGEEILGTDPNDADTDDDGIADGDEPDFDRDTDGDGLINALDPDSDNDGVRDGTELGVTEPLPDTDGGGVSDGAEDTDKDGAVDGGEIDPNDGSDDAAPQDSDGDGLTDEEELRAGSDPYDADTDDDGVLDGDEHNWTLDTDGDGLINVLDPGSDGDGILDGTERGVTEDARHPDTDVSAGNFVPDADPDTTTYQLVPDTDNGGVPDGIEDTNRNGRVDEGERDPNDPSDDNEEGNGDGDRDGDGVPDDQDNCPDTANPDQGDQDGDGLGDACDSDPGLGGDDDWIVTGGGCSAAPDAGMGWAFVLGFLMIPLLLRRRTRGLHGIIALLVIAAVSTAATSARAQDASFALERFRISVDRQGVLDVEWGGNLAAGQWDLGLWLGTSDDPLVVVQEMDGERIGRLVDHRAGGSLVGAVGITSWFQAGLELPVILSQDQSVGGLPVGMPGDLSSFGLGDLRVLPKAQLLRATRHGVDLALIPAFTLPTSTSDDYFGESRASFAPELAVSRAFGALRLATNIGYRTRKLTRLRNLEIDDEIFWRIGAGYRFGEAGGPPVEVDLSLAAATRADDLLGDPANNYAELLGAAQYRFSKPLLGFVAGGVGLNEGFGAPDWRVLIGARFGMGEPEPTRIVDTDGDGIPDSEDACPTEPENVNGFEDEDGCPEDPDSDGDGIPDSEDQCPQEPEDQDGFQDQDGCPDPDNDGDGIADTQDQCPMEPEDLDGFQDQDGCPDPDNDGDGVLDVDDACVNEPGVAGNRGCPEPDRDGDTVIDRLDNCPDEAGDPANQGCKKEQLVSIGDGKIELVDRVYFRTNRAIIQPRSFALLDNVATVLQAHATVRVRIEGHTDDRGRDAYNKRLSQQRADAVMKYLVRKGVDAERLEAVGYGEERPIAGNDTPEGRAANRRVDFNIIGAEGDGIQHQDSGPTGDTIDN